MSLTIVLRRIKGMKIKRDRLDDLFSEYIRRRAIKGGHCCERCGTYKLSYKQLQACHFHGRSKKSVRWDEDNAIGLCMGCHIYLDSHPLEKVEFFKRLLGDRFDLLNARMRVTEPVDKKAIEIYLKEKIKGVENE